jgi:hypothetical protein
MKLNFNRVQVIAETIIRKDINSSFWPNEQRTYKRQALIDKNLREGWICNFENHGLRLEIKIIISEHDYSSWPQDHRTENLNTIRSDLRFYEEFSEELDNVILHIVHKSEIAEDLRKKIYLSNHFKDKCDKIWAAQYFENGNREEMHFSIGFNRELLPEDLVILEEIKKIALSIQGAVVL